MKPWLQNSGAILVFLRLTSTTKIHSILLCKVDLLAYYHQCLFGFVWGKKKLVALARKLKLIIDVVDDVNDVCIVLYCNVMEAFGLE